jgi:Uma2 family endonuclease
MIASRLHYRMEEFFIGRRCRVLQSPVDVRLSHEDVVQPDLIVVCNPKQIKATHIDGPPALAVEILSESSMTHDRIRKGALYARSGVREYWLVTPFPSMVEVLSLKRGAYVVHAVYGKEDVLASPVFTGLRVPLREVFEFALEPNERLRVVKESPGAYGYRKRRRA